MAKAKRNDNKRIRFFIKWLWIGTGSFIFLITLLFVLTASGLFGEMPSFEQLENPKSQLATEVYSADGVLLGKYYFQNRSIASFDEIPPLLRNTLLATEDIRFYKHSGIDYWGTLRAIVATLMGDKEGASTITQQLAKNLFLSGERSYWRKAQEALITLMIEAVMDKQRILHLYLNYAEWGVGVFGAQAAAQHYFGIPASQLNAYQAARLAAMLPRPRHYDKHRDSAFLASRTEFVLRWMPQMQLP